jgi:hypothetical protein
VIRNVNIVSKPFSTGCLAAFHTLPTVFGEDGLTRISAPEVAALAIRFSPAVELKSEYVKAAACSDARERPAKRKAHATCRDFIREHALAFLPTLHEEKGAGAADVE